MFGLEIFSLRAYVFIVYAGDAIPFNPSSLGHLMVIIIVVLQALLIS